MDLTTVLSIPRDHKDFVDGRYIGENVRPILDYTDQKAFPDFFQSIIVLRRHSIVLVGISI